MDVQLFDPVGAAEKGAWFDLLNPYTGKATGVRLNVLGYDAEPVVAVSREAQRDMIAKLKSGSDDLKDDTQDPATERAIAALIGWEGFGWGQETSKFTKELARSVLYDKKGSWIVDQIEHFGKQRANFMPASLKTS